MSLLVNSDRRILQIGRKVVGVFSVLLLSLAVAFTPLSAGKGAKEAQKFKAQGEKAREGVEKTRDQIKATVDRYNALFEAPEKKLESVHKKLSQDVEKCDKMVEDLKDQIDDFDKFAVEFFGLWQDELASFSNDSLRELSERHLDTARSGMEEWKAHLEAAGEAYKPFISSLKDQVQLLGMSLNSETVAALKQDNAPELNQMADELFERIDDILNKEKTSHDQTVEAVDEKPDEGATDDGK